MTPARSLGLVEAAALLRIHKDTFTAKEVGFVLADLKLRGLEPGDAG